MLDGAIRSEVEAGAKGGRGEGRGATRRKGIPHRIFAARKGPSSEFVARTVARLSYYRIHGRVLFCRLEALDIYIVDRAVKGARQSNRDCRSDEAMARFNYVCSICGSENVRRDAWAVWNVETQSWELSTVFDAGFCDDCDGGARLDEVEIGTVQNVTVGGY